MEIKYNKDKTVTITVTNEEYSLITSAIVSAYNDASVIGRHSTESYQPIINMLDKAYNEQVAPRLDEEL